jgi:hypothetical protein
MARTAWIRAVSRGIVGLSAMIAAADLLMIPQSQGRRRSLPPAEIAYP